MNEIQDILNVFTLKERRDFESFLKKRNKRGSIKNLELLQLLEGEGRKNLDVKLYGNPSKPAFNALQKRVKDTLIEFVANKAFASESSDEMEILKLLLASRTLFEQGAAKPAIKALEKAEKKADYIDGHSILNEIFQTKIQYAYLNPNWNVVALIEEFEANQKLHQRDIHLNMAYAIIKNEMNTLKRESLTEMIARVFGDYSLEINSDLTYKSLYQLMVLTASSAKLQNDFHSVSSYMVDLFETMLSKGPVPQKYQYYYLSMLYLMAITEFRNKRFSNSKNLLLQFNGALNESKKNYSEVFDERIAVLTALNYLYTGSIALAEQTLLKIKPPSLNRDLALLMCLFQQKKFQMAYELFKGISKSDDWYERKMGWTWVLKKNIIEILLLIELDKLDLVLNRFEKFNRRFGKKLRAIEEDRVLKFMGLVKEFYENPDAFKTDEFQKKVEDSFEFVGREQEDLFVMSFFAWLRAKIEQRDLYALTLDLVKLKN
ncbi:hypothetical protein [Croceivirga thetidis]|uniref:Tetratricopeptide repeat protein n=1 Tax=Croceivirga thetidis TaxID=2721623 RepID=A0ABX1GQD5_9FLAO|nr:hypothetical protein [Croceivirga thetidis]NKI31002.1 hypothetical protein [Croceivirga thetidis]